MSVLADLCSVDADVTTKLRHAVVLSNLVSIECHVSVLAEQSVQNLNSVRKERAELLNMRWCQNAAGCGGLELPDVVLQSVQRGLSVCDVRHLSQTLLVEQTVDASRG